MLARVIGSIKGPLVRAARSAARAYIRHAPWSAGKSWLFQDVVPRYLPLPDQAITSTIFDTVHRVTPTDFLQSRLFYFGCWEPHISRYIANRLGEGDCFVDVGANIGYYSILASKLVGASGEVWAIEASPSIFSRLLDSIELNQATNVRACGVAVHCEPTSVQIYQASDVNIGKTTIVENRGRNEHVYTKDTLVLALPLHEIVPIESLLRARVIKVDVEGAEWLVAKGVQPLLGRFSETTDWIIEVEPSSLTSLGGSIEVLVEMFSSAGYRHYRIQNDYSDDEYLLPSAEARITRLEQPLPASFDILFTRAELVAGAGVRQT